MKIWRLGLLLLAGGIAPAAAQMPPASDSPGALLLQEACQDGKLDQVKALIEHEHVPVDAPTGNLAFTALITAADGGRPDLLSYLLSQHANPDLADAEGSTPLLHACWQDRADGALALIAAGANVNLASKAGRTPLMYAANRGDDVMVKALLAAKAQLDANCSEGPAVRWAVASDHLSTVSLLVDAGAKLELPPADNPGKLSILATAASNNDVKLIDYLLQHGIDLNLAGADGRTALMVAVEKSKKEAVQHLVELHALIDLQTQKGFTALIFASNADMIQLLLSAHPNLELKDKKGRTALLWAATRYKLELVKALVEGGANINATDPQGETTLTLAGDRGEQDLVDYLREKGATRTDVHIIAREEPKEPLNLAQSWALAVDMIHFQHNGMNPHVLGGEASATEVKAMLKKEWSITDKASLLHMLDSLNDYGFHVAYCKEGKNFTSATSDETAQLSEHPERAMHLKLVKAGYLKWKERTGLAWDLCRGAMLVNEGYAAGYLQRQDAWDRLTEIARTTQASFISWRELADNFLDSREIWAEKRDPQFEACAQLLLNPKDPNSPWNQLPWKTDLPPAPSGAKLGPP